MGKTGRRFGALVAGSVIAPLCVLAAPAAADGEQTPPGAQSIDAVCAGVPDGYDPFTDVDGNQFKDAILCLAYGKVARGGPGGAPADSYVPDGRVGRDAMASFVARVIDTADRLDSGDRIRALPGYDGTPSFGDIAGNTHEAAISRLADAGVVSGGSGGARPDRYVPSGDVTRAQMASFLRRALEFMLGEPVETDADYYTDDSSDVHQRSINAVTSLGIAAGRAPDTYDPAGLIDRDNMAAFLARTLGELEERGAIEPLPAPASDDITVEQRFGEARNAVANPDTNDGDDRTYTVSGLAAGEEYRVTLVEAGTVSEGGLMGGPVFIEDGDTGLAAVGTRTADITVVNGAPAMNNAGDGTELTATDSANGGTAVTTAGGAGQLSFVVDLGAGSEAVVPVVYRNGGPINAAADGGRSPRLELNDDGTAAESVAVGGFLGELITVTPDDQTTRVAVANPDMILVDDRVYEVTGLVPGEEYRITVVDAATTTTRDDGETMFTQDGSTGLAAVGSRRTADIKSVDGAASTSGTGSGDRTPMTNTGDGTARTPNDPADSGTAVFTAGATGRVEIVLDLDARGETVLPVVYRNGGPGNALTDGGSSPRLELGPDGVPVEAYDVGGRVTAE